MLQIREIRKKYITGDLVQTALDGVSLTLRDNEFVAILGPSGSGKTTLLNIIGGLDRYDSGDLIINGISTKKYTDRDWDSYRNHTIGFVFQSYNLIPHQTVLANVELALTISGISRSERRRRAVKALEDVGLGNQLHKRPNQMSGGQMQRVAIARALVNDPDILLADEPTGALDSETSVQVMELLKAVSKDRLVVMVTHNPELAEQYANRIVRVRDGRIIDDTNPYTVDMEAMEPPKHQNMGKASMSFLTALSLSFNNLRTKKARTLLTAFAGSIGIIGIALIMSLSTGFQKYIDQIQEDTLSNYPLTIQSETADMYAAFAAVGTAIVNSEDLEPGTVAEVPMISQMFAQIGSNDLGAFKAHLEANMDSVAGAIKAVKYSYNVQPLLYSSDTEKLLQVNPSTLFGNMMSSSVMSSYMDTNVFYEMVDNQELLSSQYGVLRGRWPERYDEMVVVLSDPNRIPDYMAYTLGLKDSGGLRKMIERVMSGQEPEPADKEASLQWSYEDLMALEFRLVPASALYRYNSQYNVWENMSGDGDYMRRQISQGETMRIVGIVAPKEGVTGTLLQTGIAYTSALTRHVIETAKNSEIVASQLADPDTDVFTGAAFSEAPKDTDLNFQDMIHVDGDMLSSAFGMNISEEAVLKLLQSYLENAKDSILPDTAPAQAAFVDTLQALAQGMLKGYIAANADPATGGATLCLSDMDSMVDGYLAGAEASALLSPLAERYSLPEDAFRQVYRPLLSALVAGYIASEMAPAEPPESPTLPGIPSLPPTETDPAETASPTEADGSEPSAPSQTAPPETIPPETAPSEPHPSETAASESMPSEAPAPEAAPGAGSEAPTVTGLSVEIPAAVPDEEVSLDIDPSQIYAVISSDQVDGIVAEYAANPLVTGTAAAMAGKMTEAELQRNLLAQVSAFGDVLMRYIGSSFYVDESKIASAFQFDMNAEELKRLMEAMSGADKETNASANLKALGYADLEEPSAIAIYMTDFAGKEAVLDFLDSYNEEMKAAEQEDLVIRYTDMTGMMMSSVRTIIDSVSYVLIAFVAISLVVSSIMIGIITYISVMERTKEIGVLRAIGASKRNISQVFNAETFIIGLCSGILGVGITLALNYPINAIIHSLTEQTDINAQLPVQGAAVLVVLSMILTLISGLIPAKKAAKKDPVIALRTE